ncbi:hypothetical protein OG440_40050 (plasmid) [Streptomyces sp. NBC_00637]|uniref:hypothetical protein n=1 Tax=Streptomyces sp. NBC_00637 TaxID=2903667 RepID=UPI002F91885F
MNTNTARRRNHSIGAPRTTSLWALPFALAARLFRPSRRDLISDKAIETAQLARTVTGIAATAWLIYSYPLQESFSEVAKDEFAGILISAAMLVVVGPLVLGLFVLAARPPARAMYWRRLSGPMAGFGSLFLAVLTLYLVLQDSGGARFAAQFGVVGQLLVLVLGLTAVVFAVPFVLASAAFCVHYVFRTADVHEVLPPLLSPLLVWVMFGVQLVDSSPVSAPAAVEMLFLIGPPLSVTALSAWELRRLRTRFGLTLRSALQRGRRPRPR